MALKYLYAPSGVKAGTAYGVMPNSANADFSSFSRSSAGSRVDKNGFINTGLGLGSEEVVNGTFDTDSNWSKDTGWSISGGLATRTNTGSYGALYQNCLTNGKQYEVTITITSITSQGFFGVRLGTNYVLRGITEAGTYTETGTSTSATLSVMGNPTFAGSIDNISVREITDVNTNVPRLDYTDGGCPSLLLEPTKQNVLQRSEEFDNSYWVNNGVTINANQIISPDGTQNADLLTGVSGGFGLVRFSTWSATNKVASCFAKKGSSNIFKIANVSSSNRYVLFDLNNGTVSEQSTGWTGSIEDYGNGWYRCTAISNNETGTFSLGVTDASESVYIWGAQLEQGSYATSYIPTYGAASTRSQDVGGSTGDLSSVVNSQEGTFMIEAAYLDSVLNRISLNNAATTSANRITILADNTRFNVFYYVNNVGGSGLMFTSDLYENSKIAIRWKNGSITGYLNGTEGFTATNIGEFPTGILDRITLGISNGTAHFKGQVKQLRVYDEYLSDSEIEELTSWKSFNEMANALNYTIE